MNYCYDCGYYPEGQLPYFCLELDERQVKPSVNSRRVFPASPACGKFKEREKKTCGMCRFYMLSQEWLEGCGGHGCWRVSDGRSFYQRDSSIPICSKFEEVTK